MVRLFKAYPFTEESSECTSDASNQDAGNSAAGGGASAGGASAAGGGASAGGGGAVSYSCAGCRTHLAMHTQLISKSFQGNRGRAYLFSRVAAANVRCDSQPVLRNLLTGSHRVRDLHCAICCALIGWKYETAFVAAQKYKEGKFIIEAAHLIKENGWEQPPPSFSSGFSGASSRSNSVSLSSSPPAHPIETSHFTEKAPQTPLNDVSTQFSAAGSTTSSSASCSASCSASTASSSHHVGRMIS